LKPKNPLGGLLLVIALFLSPLSAVAQSNESVGIRQSQILSHPQGDSFFGSLVDIDGNQAIVSSGPDAFVYQLENGNWVLDAALPLDSFSGFGTTSVAISGDYAVVGNRYDDTVDTEAGATLVFEKRSGIWVEVSKLTVSEGDDFLAFFGSDVAIEGNTMVVGSYGRDVGEDSLSGAAYVYERLSGVWTLVETLRASDSEPSKYFGFSVAISGSTIVVGARQDSIDVFWAGSAYVFDNSGGSWGEVAKLTASDAGRADWFGNSVSIEDDLILVGAVYKDSTNGDSSTGSAYVFERSAQNTWAQQAKLVANPSTEFEFFGESVSLSGNKAVVGTDDGNVYVFQLENGNWTRAFDLQRNNPPPGFGNSVSISSDNVLVGGGGRDPYIGSVFSYKLSQPGACIDPDGDGYGWDGVRTCSISTTCIDSDGDGWGWDGVGSCRVGEIPVVECFDADGDGWGWDGLDTCIVGQ